MVETAVIASKIEECMEVVPTSNQKKSISDIASYIATSKSRDVMILNGYAGSGKTTIISALSKALLQVGIKCVMVAPTGRAAKVMSKYSSQPTFTIHKKIYRQKSAMVEQFSLDRNENAFTYFIVDEASMINDSSYDSIFGSGNLLLDLMQYVASGRGCRLIIVGDKAQLPPVGQLRSPALDKYNMERLVPNLYYSELTEVVRQQKESIILKNATAVRALIVNQSEQYPKFELNNNEFTHIMPSDFIDELESAYSKYGNDEVMVITRSNKQARMLNEVIRRRIHYMDEELSSGDKVMVVKNNYAHGGENVDFIANGDIATIKRVRKYENIYGFRFVLATLLFEDYDNLEIEAKMMLDTLSQDTPALTQEQNRDLFYKVEEDYMDITNKKERYKKMREDPYLNALQVKFSYAITCHKSQGGQWDCIFIDRMLFGDETITIEWLRWLYTAITRATKKVVLINFDDNFF